MHLHCNRLFGINHPSEGLLIGLLSRIHDGLVASRAPTTSYFPVKKMSPRRAVE